MATPTTEQRNPRTLAIDEVATIEILRMVNEEDARVAGAVGAELPRLSKLVDAAVDAMRAGGRVHYFGAGTSGRLAVLDAAELLPTFHAPDDLVVAHHAGGMAALLRAVENVEDSEEGGSADASTVTGLDVVIGLAASGSTPYVAGALRAARAAGAITALVTSNPAAPLAGLADILIAADTGAEVIAGSTRLKAGTAQKMILNAFSTTLMIKLGRTWS
ncbi:MAG: N-acetylmuramic acid 6-phosphate etherase, partial [Nocardioidaceae bacterium]